MKVGSRWLYGRKFLYLVSELCKVTGNTVLIVFFIVFAMMLSQLLVFRHQTAH
jgi:hypothetical protein